MSDNCDYCGLPPPYPDWCVIEGQCAKDQARIRAAYLRGLEDAAKVAENHQDWAPNWGEDRNRAVADQTVREIVDAIRALAKEDG